MDWKNELRPLVIYLTPLLGVVVGWVLNEFSQSRRLSRERVGAVGCVLSDLLDMRFSLLAVDHTVRKLSALGLPRGQEPTLKAAFKQLFPELMGDHPGFHERYQTAVDTIATGNPVLAYQLRGRDMLTPTLDRLRALASQEAPLAGAWAGFESNLTEMIIPRIEELARELAKVHGFRARFEVRRTLRRPLDAPEVDELISNFLDRLKGHQG